MKKYGMKFIRILLLSLSLLLLTGCQQEQKPFDHSFLSFEEIFQNSLDPELPSFSAAPGAKIGYGLPGSPGFKIGRFSSPATCQVKCNSKLEKISEGEFQLRHLRGR